MVALAPAPEYFNEQCLVATVAARPLSGVQQFPPEIDLFFAVPEEIELDPQKQWIMVEARDGYFEANRHTLMSLKRLRGEK